MSDIQYISMPIAMTIQGRFVTAASTPSWPGIDTAIARTADNRLMLPFSAVKGKLREALEETADESVEKWIAHWLGPLSTDPEKPDRSRLRFSDFVGAEPLPAVVPTETRIAYDPQRMSAKHGALQVYESPVAAGEQQVLLGRVRFLAKSEEVPTVRNTILAGLRLVTQFGSNRTVGFGRVTKVACYGETEKHLLLTNTDDISELDPADFLLELTPEAAFCVSKHKVAENIFESESAISGSVIKGVIASMLREAAGLSPGGHATEGEIKAKPWSTLAKHLDQVRFTTANPVGATSAQRILPAVPPLTLVKTASMVVRQGYKFRDVALCNRPCLLESTGKWQAPEFAVDWKEADAGDVEAAFGLSRPSSELRVRTKVNRHLRRAEDSQLFAYEMIRPQGYVWVARVSLAAVPEDKRSEVLRVLAMLTRKGVWGIGKTKAYAKVRLLPCDAYQRPVLAQESPKPPAQNTYVVTLQSPALIHDPAEAHFKDLAGSTTRSQLLFDAYKAYWNAASGGVLKLVRFFAQQQLAGGEYIAHRFLKARSATDYRPYVLTNSGGVFVLAIDENRTADDANKLFNHWKRSGLPLSTRLGDDLRFDQCPYRPQEGFGEIAVNMEVHTRLCPGPRERQDIDL